MKKPILVILIILVIVAGLIALYLFKNQSPDYSNTGSQAYEQQVLNNEGEYVLSDGSYAVNAHIPAGEYKVKSRDDSMTIKVIDSENDEVDYSDVKVGDTITLGDTSRVVMISGGTLVLEQ